MPIGYLIDTERGVVRIEMFDTMLPGEVVDFLERLAADPDLAPGMPQLVDFTAIATPPTAAESETVANAFSRLRHCFSGARCAVVVADSLGYGAIRQFAALAARAEVEVRPFLDHRSAAEWLGVEPD